MRRRVRGAVADPNPPYAPVTSGGSLGDRDSASAARCDGANRTRRCISTLRKKSRSHMRACHPGFQYPASTVTIASNIRFGGSSLKNRSRNSFAPRAGYRRPVVRRREARWRMREDGDVGERRFVHAQPEPAGEQRGAPGGVDDRSRANALHRLTTVETLAAGVLPPDLDVHAVVVERDLQDAVALAHIRAARAGVAQQQVIELGAGHLPRLGLWNLAP